MLQIGAKPNKEGEGPLELLLACHARIRSFTALAARLASDEPASAEDVAETARRIHRYHAIALPLHQADEEQSIAPRLGGVDEAVAAMKQEHVGLDQVLARLLPIWDALARDPGRRRELSPAMAQEVARMEALWARHLSAEEALVFPALRRVPDPAEILEEMRARRR